MPKPKLTSAFNRFQNESILWTKKASRGNFGNIEKKDSKNPTFLIYFHVRSSEIVCFSLKYHLIPFSNECYPCLFIYFCLGSKFKIFSSIFNTGQLFNSRFVWHNFLFHFPWADPNGRSTYVWPTWWISIIYRNCFIFTGISWDCNIFLL